MTAGRFERSAPRLLFTGNFHRDEYGDQSWDVARDGRFLMLRPVLAGEMQVDVVLNWIEEVRARMETPR